MKPDKAMSIMDSMRRAVTEMATSSVENLHNMRKQLIQQSSECQPDMSPFILKMLELVNEFIRLGADERRRDHFLRMLLPQISEMEKMLKSKPGKER